MKHVAQAAGVSVMTVSLALRRDPRIPAGTREHVLATAARVGYRRNPLVSALMAGLRGWHPRRSDAHVIAYVESYSEAATRQQSASLRRFRDGAREAAAQHGYRLEVFHMGEQGLSEDRLKRVLHARGIRGVVFAPFPRTGSALAQSWDEHAMATLGFSLAQPPLHRAVNHQVHSFRLALAQLLALGYRRVGLVMSRHEDQRVERNWISSALLAQHEHAGTDRAFPLFFVEQVEREPLLTWLRRQRPDVVLSTEPGVQAIVRGASATPEAGIGFAHLHLSARGGGCAGIDQNNERVGAAAVDLVVEQLHGNHYGVPANPKTVLIEGRWVPGRTAPGPGGRQQKPTSRPSCA